MSEPIKSGDIAIIIAGALGDKGPNVGKTVTVGMLRGEHSKYGRIWAVSGQNLVSEYGAVGSNVDCAAAWLRKVEPPKATNVQSYADSVDATRNFLCNLQLVAVLRSYKKCNAMQHHPKGCCSVAL